MMTIHQRKIGRGEKGVTFGINTTFVVCDNQDYVESRNGSYWMRLGMQNYLWNIKKNKILHEIKWIFEPDYREYIYENRYMEKNNNKNFYYFIGLN